MAMNPETNEMELLMTKDEIESVFRRPIRPALPGQLYRPNGQPVPEHWSKYTVGEEVELKGYRFRIGHISEGALLLEPVGPVLVGDKPHKQGESQP